MLECNDDQIVSALGRLKERDLGIPLLRAGGLKHREIAEGVGTTTGSVGTLLRSALAIVQQEHPEATQPTPRRSIEETASAPVPPPAVTEAAAPPAPAVVVETTPPPAAVVTATPPPATPAAALLELLNLLWSIDPAVAALTKEREALATRQEHTSWSERGSAIVDLLELRSRVLRICYPGRVELTANGYAEVRTILNADERRERNRERYHRGRAEMARETEVASHA